MPSQRQLVGAAGEATAAQWYESRGYKVLARNFRSRRGEVDLIVANGQLVVFAEVKTRSSGAFGSGAEAVTWQKRQRIRRVAAAWLEAAPTPVVQVRFDVVEVGPHGATVIQGAF